MLYLGLLPKITPAALPLIAGSAILFYAKAVCVIASGLNFKDLVTSPWVFPSGGEKGNRSGRQYHDLCHSSSASGGEMADSFLVSKI